MSQSVKSYFCAWRYDPFPPSCPVDRMEWVKSINLMSTLKYCRPIAKHIKAKKLKQRGLLSRELYLLFPLRQLFYLLISVVLLLKPYDGNFSRNFVSAPQVKQTGLCMLPCCVAKLVAPGALSVAGEASVLALLNVAVVQGLPVQVGDNHLLSIYWVPQKFSVVLRCTIYVMCQCGTPAHMYPCVFSVRHSIKHSCTDPCVLLMCRLKASAIGGQIFHKEFFL